MSMTRRKAVNILGLGALTAFGAPSMPLLANPESASGTPVDDADAGSVHPSAKSVVSFPRSPVFKGIKWLGDEIPYAEQEKRGDTFPVTWAADGNLYTSAGDPSWPDKGSGLDVECISGMPPSHHIERVNPMRDYTGSGGCGAKPTGILSVGGTLYLMVQNITGTSDLPREARNIVATYGHGYDAQIVQSKDFGKTWQPDIKTIAKPMFPGRVFGSPAFINYGRDHDGASDGFVYAISGDGWDNGLHLKLGRVPNDHILDAGKWEWISKMGPDNHPVWSGHLSEATAILTHPGYLGYVDMVYLLKQRRYLVLSWHHKVKSNPDAGSELIVYDSPEPWGPFTLVHHEDPWETPLLNPYNPRLPLKWMDQDKLEGWLLFSGSWRASGMTPAYRMHVRRFRLLAY